MGCLDILASAYRNVDVVSALQAVGNDDGTADAERGEAVFPGAVEVLEGILPEAWIHGVAVGQEGLPSELLDNVHYGFGEVGAQETDVAELSEVHFDGDELAVEIYVADTGGADESLKLFGNGLTVHLGPEVGEIHFGFFHGIYLRSVMI